MDIWIELNQYLRALIGNRKDRIPDVLTSLTDGSIPIFAKALGMLLLRVAAPLVQPSIPPSTLR
jgi:hypothetical protein